jgi:hypothetical protein
VPLTASGFRETLPSTLIAMDVVDCGQSRHWLPPQSDNGAGRANSLQAVAADHDTTLICVALLVGAVAVLLSAQRRAPVHERLAPLATGFSVTLGAGPGTPERQPSHRTCQSERLPAQWQYAAAPRGCFTGIAKPCGAMGAVFVAEDAAPGRPLPRLLRGAEGGSGSPFPPRAAPARASRRRALSAPMRGPSCSGFH